MLNVISEFDPRPPPNIQPLQFTLVLIVSTSFFFGGVGLVGRVRREGAQKNHIEKKTNRDRESGKLGFKTYLISSVNLKFLISINSVSSSVKMGAIIQTLSCYSKL